MARFAELVPQLDPYREANNLERVRRLKMGRRSVSQEAIPSSGLSIIVLNKNRPDLLAALWRSYPVLRELAGERGIEVELRVGDTGSTDPEAVALLESPPEGCSIERNLVYQFSRCNNDLFVRSRYDVSLFMNNDVLFDRNPSALLDCYERLKGDESIGVLGTVLYFADGTIQHAGIDFFRDPAVFALSYHPGAHSTQQFPSPLFFPAPAVTGAFMMLPSELFAEVGGFDESYAKECQDIDLCLKIVRSGKRIEIGSLGELIHLENGTRETGEEDWIDRSLFLRRWSSFVESL